MLDFARQKWVVDLGRWINMYALDVLGELFYGQDFVFLRKRKEIGNVMNAIQSLFPPLTISGTLPFYLRKLYLLSTTLLSPSLYGALGNFKYLNTVAEIAVNKRKWEMDEKKDNKRDILLKMLEINAHQGAELNFTYKHFNIESRSSL
jgi:hypothetical protein